MRQVFRNGLTLYKPTRGRKTAKEHADKNQSCKQDGHVPKFRVAYRGIRKNLEALATRFGVAFAAARFD